MAHDLNIISKLHYTTPCSTLRPSPTAAPSRDNRSNTAVASPTIFFDNCRCSAKCFADALARRRSASRAVCKVAAPPGATLPWSTMTLTIGNGLSGQTNRKTAQRKSYTHSLLTSMTSSRGRSKNWLPLDTCKSNKQMKAKEPRQAIITDTRSCLHEMNKSR
jgi:hypothetical protein